MMIICLNNFFLGNINFTIRVNPYQVVEGYLFFENVGSFYYKCLFQENQIIDHE